jgi:hypothetical protein
VTGISIKLSDGTEVDFGDNSNKLTFNTDHDLLTYEKLVGFQTQSDSTNFITGVAIIVASPCAADLSRLTETYSLAKNAGVFTTSLIDSQQPATYEIECAVGERIEVDLTLSGGKVTFDVATYEVSFLDDVPGLYPYTVKNTYRGESSTY